MTDKPHCEVSGEEMCREGTDGEWYCGKDMSECHCELESADNMISVMKQIEDFFQ